MFHLPLITRYQARSSCLHTVDLSLKRFGSMIGLPPSMNAVGRIGGIKEWYKTSIKCYITLLVMILAHLINSLPLYYCHCSVYIFITVLLLFFSAWPGSGAPLSRYLEGALYKF